MAFVAVPDLAQAPVPTGDGASVLSVRGLSKRYANGFEVLAGVHLAVAPGQSVAIIGANGSGKSTLLRCCVRLVEPTAGEICVLGEEVHRASRRSLRHVRRRVGFVFQNHNLVPRLSVLSNVIHGGIGRSMCAWHQAVAPREMREEAMTCLERVGLADLARRRADRLSGGQSQRVAIARTLMQRPEIVFADEPVASLDPTAGEEVMALFAKLMRECGITVVFTTHHLGHARAHADRVIALKAGRVVFDQASSMVAFDSLGDLYAR